MSQIQSVVFDPALLADPWAYWDALRAQGPAVWRSVAPHFGFETDACAIERMIDESRFYSKDDPARRVFSGDAPDCRPLTGAICEAVKCFVGPGYGGPFGDCHALPRADRRMRPSGRIGPLFAWLTRRYSLAEVRTGPLCQDIVMNPGEGDEVELTFQLIWPDDTGNRAVAANQVVFSWDQDVKDLMYMHLGHVVAPPPNFVNPNVLRRRMGAGEGTGLELLIEPVGSFALSRRRAEELYRALGRHLGIAQ